MYTIPVITEFVTKKNSTDMIYCRRNRGAILHCGIIANLPQLAQLTINFSSQFQVNFKSICTNISWINEFRSTLFVKECVIYALSFIIIASH